MDIFNEEKFEKGGVILERIHPDLDVEPYVPYYERMGYVVSIVEKPNGWVELIGEKKYDKKLIDLGYVLDDNFGYKNEKTNHYIHFDDVTGEVSKNGNLYTTFEPPSNKEYLKNEPSNANTIYKLVYDVYYNNEINNGLQGTFGIGHAGILKRQKKDTFEDAYGRFKDDIRENMTPRKMAKGGRTKIENDGVDFNEQMYKGILGDRDKDGTENADDVEPNNPNISKNIEGTKFTDTFKTLLDDKKMYDDSMYSIIGKMEKMLPNKFDIIARTKTPFSIIKKLVEKRLKFKKDKFGKIKNKGLTDVIGTTIATNSTSELMNLRGMIGVDNGDNGIFGEVIEIDDKFKIPACGYRAIHYIVLYNGVPVEIQLKTKRMKMLNEFTHPFYKAKDLDCDGMGDLSEIVVMADNGSKEAQKEFTDIFADKERLRSMVSKSYARGGEVEWFDYSKIDLEELPYELDRYFIKDADTKEIDLNLLEPTRAREKGVKNANKYMRMAYDGEIDRRKPISVYERNGEMFVFDGNSTIANAKNSGWKTIYVEMIDDPNEDFEKGGRTKDAETLREIAKALKKGSSMHEKQSEQLMGASSAHKKQTKNLDRIADKMDKGYARGGKLSELEREEIPTMIYKSSMSEYEFFDSAFVQLHLSDRWITKNEFNRLKKILKKYDANGYFSSVKDKNDKRFLREDIDVNILGYKNLNNFLREIDNDFDFEVNIVKVTSDEDEDGLSEDGEVDLDYFEQSSTQTNKFRDTKGNYKDVVNTDSDKLVYEEEDLNWNFIKFAESPEFVYYVNDYELEADFDDVEENNTFEYMAIHKPSKRGGVWVGHYVDYMPLQMEYKANALTFKHPRLDESLKKFSEDDLLFPF